MKSDINSDPKAEKTVIPFPAPQLPNIPASSDDPFQPELDEQVPLPDILKENIMPRGDKSKYTDKQKRQAEHIEDSYRERGSSEHEAEARAWATVNKQDGGGKKAGSGRGKKTSSRQPTR